MKIGDANNYFRARKRKDLKYKTTLVGFTIVLMLLLQLL